MRCYLNTFARLTKTCGRDRDSEGAKLREKRSTRSWRICTVCVCSFSSCITAYTVHTIHQRVWHRYGWRWRWAWCLYMWFFLQLSILNGSTPYVRCAMYMYERASLCMLCWETGTHTRMNDNVYTWNASASPQWNEILRVDAVVASNCFRFRMAHRMPKQEKKKTANKQTNKWSAHYMAL